MNSGSDLAYGGFGTRVSPVVLDNGNGNGYGNRDRRPGASASTPSPVDPNAGQGLQAPVPQPNQRIPSQNLSMECISQQLIPIGPTADHHHKNNKNNNEY